MSSEGKPGTSSVPVYQGGVETPSSSVLIIAEVPAEEPRKEADFGLG
jgi:hypothetical protein